MAPVRSGDHCALRRAIRNGIPNRVGQSIRLLTTDRIAEDGRPTGDPQSRRAASRLNGASGKAISAAVSG